LLTHRAPGPETVPLRLEGPVLSHGRRVGGTGE
jgi:hypothetical protein